MGRDAIREWLVAPMALVPLLYSGLPLLGQRLLQHTVLVAEESILFWERVRHLPELRKLASQGEASRSAPAGFIHVLPLKCVASSVRGSYHQVLEGS